MLQIIFLISRTMQATPAQDILRVPSVRVRYYLKASIPYLKLSNQLDWVQNTHSLKISVWQYFFQYIEEHLKNKRQRESLNPCANTTNPCRWCEWSSSTSAQNVMSVMRVFFLKRNWMLTLKLYTRTPPEVWWLVIALNWNQLKVRRKKTLVILIASSWWRRSLLPTLSQLPKLYWIYAKWASFELISAKKKKGLRYNRVNCLQEKGRRLQFPKFSQNLVSFLCKYISWY